VRSGIGTVPYMTDGGCW